MTKEAMDLAKSRALSQLNDGGGRTQARADISRRDWLRLTVTGGAGLALGGVLDLSTVKAAAQNLKLSNVREFTTSCNFCSCGCGMVAAVREGKLITMEGDYDHIVNRGSLCVKGISMFATHTSPNRLTTPRYRAPTTGRRSPGMTRSCGLRTRFGRRDATWIATSGR